jgi:hypothetical protein
MIEGTPFEVEVKLRESLAKLGEYTEDVIRVLREKGIKGTQGNCMTCPIARYLIAEGFFGPGVDRDFITLYTDHDDIFIEIETPYNIAMFISIFDGTALYSDLIEG